jgi:DNA-binding Xre family transcriptional regulator
MTEHTKKTTYRGVSRGRPLTKPEAAEYRKVREQVELEIPPAKPSPTKVAIAKLRAMREARGVSLSELADRTGIARGSLARLETQKKATLQTLQRYAEGLECELQIDVISARVTAKRNGLTGTADRTTHAAR